MSLYEQRESYRRALDQLTTGRSSDFERSRKALAGYVLAPYLDYYDVRTRLSSVSDKEMRGFLNDHADLPASRTLQYRWLKHLGARREWRRLLDNYAVTVDPELRCYHLRALLATGEHDAAFAGVAELWTVGSSQPKACDPLFDAWIDAGLLNEGRVWERLQLALDANERHLARYLLRFFEGPLSEWAKALYDVHVNPESVARSGAFHEDNPYLRVVIAHGLERLARRDPEAAANAWERLHDSHEFSPADVRAVSESILLALAREGAFPSRRPDNVSAEFAAGMADAALQAENWKELLHWVEQLPGDDQSNLRWQYWQARALDQTHLSSEQARLTYASLAGERHYYGFLAAGLSGRQPSMNPAGRTADAAALSALQQRPGLARALELFAVGDLLNARREWFAEMSTLDPQQQYLAALLAQQVGWVAQGISTANDANLRDSLDVRFPVAYPDVFQRISYTTTVPQPFLLAVARQESAFDPQARSPVNARGLMQLMLPTATLVADRIGVTEPSATDLYNPSVNVELGGHHLAELLARYANQRPLAAAAYNAGEHRVDRWVANAQGLPMDVWIETIPYHETRNYVKNVLAFAQVYGQILGKPEPMLAPHEVSVN